MQLNKNFLWVIIFILFPARGFCNGYTMIPDPNKIAIQNGIVQKSNPEPVPRITSRIQKTFSRFVPYYIFIFLGGFIMLAIIRILNPPYLLNLAAATINLKLLIGLFRDGIFGFNFTNLLLDLLCITMLSMCIQLYYFSSHLDLFIWILAFTSIGYFLKLILIQLFGNIFMGRTESLVHLLMHLLFTRILGLLLLPVLFIGLYQTVIDINILLQAIVIAIVILYTGWFLRLFIQMKSMSASGIIYLFLYLCTIEISPFAIILRDYIR